MFSKALYKQSWKANWVMWLSTTLVSLFVLVIIMSLVGGQSIGSLTTSFTETIIYENLETNYENQSLNYYTLTEETLIDFDEEFINEYVIELKENPFVEPNEETFEKAFLNAFNKIDAGMLERLKKVYPELKETDELYIELSNAIKVAFSEEMHTSTYDVFSLVSHLEAADYLVIWTTEDLPDNLYEGKNSEARVNYRLERSKNSSTLFLSVSMTDPLVIDRIVENLKSYNITHEIYDSFGFDSEGLTYIANTAILTYQARLDYELENNKDLPEEVVKENLKASIAKNFVDELPDDVKVILDELDGGDIYSNTLVSMYYKIVGMLIIIIFIIMVSVNLISGQVDTGSMAYILSTGTKRKTLTATQALFLVSSVFLSFLVTTVTSLIVYTIATPVNSEMTYLKLIIFGVGTFLIAFAFSGINFLSSTIFNRSRQAMAIGGGITILMLIFTILGMFGSESMPQMMRLDVLNAFNYFSLITLLDEAAILSGSLVILWKFGILTAVGLICFIIGARIFKSKDLPL